MYDLMTLNTSIFTDSSLHSINPLGDCPLVSQRLKALEPPAHYVTRLFKLADAFGQVENYEQDRSIQSKTTQYIKTSST